MATGGTALGFLAARVPQGSPQRGFFGNKRQLWRDPWCPLVAISCSWRFPARMKAWMKLPWKTRSNFRDAAAAAVVCFCPGLPGSSPPESQIHSDCCPFTNQQALYCWGQQTACLSEICKPDPHSYHWLSVLVSFSSLLFSADQP